MSFFVKNTNKNACDHLFSRKHWLGLPIHIKMLSILINSGYYTLLVLNRALQDNFIALAIVPSSELPIGSGSSTAERQRRQFLLVDLDLAGSDAGVGILFEKVRVVHIQVLTSHFSMPKRNSQQGIDNRGQPIGNSQQGIPIYIYIYIYYF